MNGKTVLNVLDGAKTFLGGLILIGGGIVGMVFGVVPVDAGVAAVGAGLSVWGLGQKLEKLTAATKSNAFSDLKLEKEQTTLTQTTVTGTKP